MKRALALVTVLAAACGGGGTDQTPDAPVVQATPLYGTFTVSLVPETTGASATPAYSAMLGKIYDGAQPEAVQWIAMGSAGGCTLSTPKVPFCATPCGGTAVCVADNTCKPYPTAQPLGTVTATGLHTMDGAASFAMDPIANAYQPPSTVKLAYPAFGEGETFKISAAGTATVPAFSVETKGVAALNLTTSPINLARNTALALAWTAPAAQGSQIHIKLDISHHGGSKGKLECDLPDTGSVSIDGTLMTQLLDLGAAGYPTIIVTRSGKTAASSIEGELALVASSTVEKPVTVPGITSCTDTSECPMGQTCQSDLTCK